MPSPTDSERRQQRDAALRTQDEQIADALHQALVSGELRSAESWGKPLAELEGWAQTPVEFRLPFKVLKNAGIAPPEVDLFHRRASMRATLEQTPAGTAAHRELCRQLSELEQVIALRLESMRASGSI
jgi:DNA-binding GntR family transcriptional regulator